MSYRADGLSCDGCSGVFLTTYDYSVASVNQEVVKHGWTVLAAEHYCFTCTLERKKVKAKKLEDKARVHAVVLVQALEAILPLAETLVSRYAEEFDSYKTRMARILLESLIPEKEVQ